MAKHFREREIKQLGNTLTDFIIAFGFPFPNGFQTRTNGSGNKIALRGEVTVSRRP
jgi:hypothetical protein